MFNSISFIMTNKCTAECEMCCMECSPKNNVFLDKGFVKKVIDDARNTEVSTISFTGGEPFLHIDLLELVEYCQGRFRTTINTNGYFAKNEEKTYEILKQLEAVGLSQIFVSTDVFHQKFVPLSVVQNLLYACNRTKILCTLTLGVVRDGFETDTSISALGDAIFETTLQFHPMMPVGAGRDLTDCFISRKTTGLKCTYGKQLSISYDKKAYPCCSQGIYGTCLCLGDMNFSGLNQIFSNARKHILFNMILQKGFDNILMILKRHNILFSEFVNECHLCSLIFSDERAIDILLNDFDSRDYNILAR